MQLGKKCAIPGSLTSNLKLFLRLFSIQALRDAREIRPTRADKKGTFAAERILTLQNSITPLQATRSL
jgi:hypothetical protein